MSDNTAIEWTDATWNPVRGCTRVSQGCVNCYAETVAARFSNKGQAYEGLATRSPARWTGEVRVIEAALDQPLRWKRPRKIFVNSMSDLFHEKLDARYIDRVFAVMALAPQHTFQVLTKRPQRMLSYLQDRTKRGQLPIAQNGMDLGNLWFDGWLKPWPLPNLWLGVSVENQEAADERIPLLLQTPAAKRFLSCEPLLGSLDLSEALAVEQVKLFDRQRSHWTERTGESRKIDWVIAGGESGPKARPMHPDWARALRDQCNAAGAAFFFKQWGEWEPREQWSGHQGGGRFEPMIAITPDGSQVPHDVVPQDVGGQRFARVGKKHAGRRLDGVEHSEFPEAA